MEFPERTPVPLWTGIPPLSRGSEPNDIPTITIYRPAVWKTTRTAIIVLPGGGYSNLTVFEGSNYAEFLADNGHTAFVVNYRLGGRHGYHHPVELSDAARAVRLVRANANTIGIRQNRIGIMGSSAGGHLAACCATFHELGLREDGESREKDLGRPDFSILCYAVISGMEPWGNSGSFKNLLGPEADPETLHLLSMEKSVDADTPPSFIWSTYEDTVVPPENALHYASALRKFNIPFELHIYEAGPHALGLGDGHPWCGELLRWLNTI